MRTVGLTITGAIPVDLVQEMGLASGKVYFLQVIEGPGALRLAGADTRPDPAVAPAHRFPALASVDIEPETGFGLWAWTGSGATCVIAVSESP